MSTSTILPADAPIASALRQRLPHADAAESEHGPAFARAAELLLGGVILRIAGVAHRVAEVEFYWTSEAHPDPFTHADPIQRAFGRWYFHRQGNTYKGGTYKGVDVAVGGDRVVAGILIRSVIAIESGALIDGSCNVVDAILAATGAASVAALAGSFDRSIDRPAAGDSPLFLEAAPSAEAPPIYASARVGLTLKKGADPLRCRYLGRPYRFLSAPARIHKGPYLIVALHQQGRTPGEIAAITGANPATVARIIDGAVAGHGRDPADYRRGLSARELCELLGALA